MDLVEFTKFLKHLSPLGVEQAVEWWRIVGMVNCVFKDNCIPLFGLCRCSYYSSGHIARQFGDRQEIPNDDGIFHILVFTERVFGRIHETWLKRMVAKDICFPWFLHPIQSYKTWLIVDIRSVCMEAKDYPKSNKTKRID